MSQYIYQEKRKKQVFFSLDSTIHVETRAASSAFVYGIMNY